MKKFVFLTISLMKKSFSFVIVHIAVLFEAVLMPQLRTTLKYSPSLPLFTLPLFIILDISLILIIGYCLGYATKVNQKSSFYIFHGIFLIAYNLLLLLLHSKGFVSFSTEFILIPLLLIGYGLCQLLNRSNIINK